MRGILYFLLLGGVTLTSQQALALGLGSADVRSYLGEPLHARIELINASAEELNTMTAALASAADIERLGLTRTISVPLHFRVNTDPSNAFVEVSSRLPINDPVVQIVIQVRWSGGRMLREYNLFIDPPTVAAAAPAARVAAGRQSPEPASETYPDPSTLDVVETQKAQASPVPAPVLTQPRPAAREPEPVVIEAPRQPEPAEARAPAADPEPLQPAATVPADHLVDEPFPESGPAEVAEETAPPGPLEVPADQDIAALGEAAAQVDFAAGEDEARPATESPDAEDATARVDDRGNYGPVQRGETLWGIAADLTRNTEYSVNQAMLAIQRLNPDAFGGNNINSLKRGAILRLPTSSEVRRLDRRQAMLEAMRQEDAYRAMRAGLPYDDVPPLLADAALEDLAQPDTPAAVEPVSIDADSIVDDQARLELVPPSSGEQSPGGMGDEQTQATGAMSSDELEEVLARTEEELANAQQENAYLNERIRELEEQLGSGADDGLVTNNEMAALESGLREQRVDARQSTAAQASDEEPAATAAWMQWLIALLAAAVLFLVWLLRRIARGAAPKPDAAAELASESELQTVGGIRNEAEEILQTLDGARDRGDDSAGKVVELGSAGERGRRKAKPADDTEVIELDTNDPETQLDLARAYISMGDAEAARAMLESVIQGGTDAQVSEARGMMKELES